MQVAHRTGEVVTAPDALRPAVERALDRVAVVERLDDAQALVLAESGANLLLLGATLAVSAISVAAERVTAVHGAVHLLLFVLYALALFA